MGHRTLLVAANGRVASRVAAKLSAAGDAPDVLVRDAAKAQRVLVDDRGRPTYRDLFVGELANDETMRGAMSRAAIAFLAVGSGPAQVDLEVTDPGSLEPRWARLIAGVVAELRPTVGLSGEVTTTLPVGAGLSIAGLVALLWAIIEAPNKGWTSQPVLIGFALGIGILVTFIVWELRTAHPMLDVRFFENPRFSAWFTAWRSTAWFAASRTRRSCQGDFGSH